MTMESILLKQATYCGESGLYINDKGELIDPIQGKQVVGVGIPQVDDVDDFYRVLNEEHI